MAAFRMLRVVALLTCSLFGAVPSALAAGRIVLIGGAASEGPAQHAYPDGIRTIQALLAASPDVRAQASLTVAAYPDGWPTDPAALNDAATIVFYFDGLQKHPLVDASQRAQFERAMKAGAGLIALHQATTVPAEDTSINLQQWLGGARYGMFDRTTEMVKLDPASHPVTRGVAAFTYRDEFYPTLRFIPGRSVTALLTGKLHPDFREGRHLVLDQPIVSTVAWAYERDDGGRAVGFTGAHYLASLDEPALRKLLLNAIFWTARFEVPREGVRDALAPDAASRLTDRSPRAPAPAATPDLASREAIVTRSSQNEVLEQSWGRITWYVSGKLGNSTTMTVGQAIIRPGQENPHHYHPNCDEILRVARGRILHSMGDRKVEMSAGDTVSIPTGMRHNAKNIGTEDAVLEISFSSADRQVIGE